MSRPPCHDPSRRQFLTRSAALAGALGAGAAWAGAPSRLRVATDSAPRAPLGQDEAIRVAMIGPGGMGRGHLDALMRANEGGEAKVEVVALAEVCKPRLDRALESCRSRQEVEVEGYRDYTEMLARDDIHAVFVASPEHWHAQHAIDCIRAGKDVYLEKPMCLRLDDALALKEVVDANDKIVQVGTQYMMMPKYEEARRLIAEGAIGHPTLSQTSYCRNSRDGEWLYGIDESVVPGEMLDWKAWCGPLGEHEFDTEVYHRWRRYRTWSTGIVGDLLVHQMTPMIYALDAGYPTRVTATGGHYVDKDMENHDNVFLSIDFGGEHTMVIAGSTCNDTGLETLIRGHEANLLLGGNNCVLQPQTPFVDDVDPQDISCRGGDWHDELRLDFLACVRSREPNRSTVELGLKHMVAVDLATRSLWEGGAFGFDPETGEVTKL